MTKSFPLRIWWSGQYVIWCFDNYIKHRTTDIRHLTSCAGNFFTTHSTPLQLRDSHFPAALLEPEADAGLQLARAEQVAASRLVLAKTSYWNHASARVRGRAAG